MTVNREELLVELVDADGRATGSTTVAEAHTPPGRRHRAFSVLLVDRTGAVLLQQRAGAKTRFPLRWSNTCCGHPAPGASVERAAGQRLVEEMGVDGVPLRAVGVYSYRATDAVNNLVEDEYDHVLIGRLDRRPVTPDPAEVFDLRWVPLPELRADMSTTPDAYTPWLAGVLEVAEPVLPDLSVRGT